ncbi:hypothetical protein LVJ94_12815 [Pendulispora rubella]|uniref:Uncharacterized protein n=1 Tax=Pendulispora rubella TaxID=2741070 RepID=A0ABZ2LFZ0_9BACT
MQKATVDFGVSLMPEHQVELLVADLSLARALFEGVPSARLLSRVQLARDESNQAAWDEWLARVTAHQPEDLERLRRAIARHARQALDEGPIVAENGTVAALVFGFFCNESDDASLAESSHPPPEALVRACSFYDGRLGAKGDTRVPMLEACIRIATLASAGPWAHERLMDAVAQLATSEIGILWPAAEQRLFPIDFQVAPDHARMTRIDRASLDALVARDPRELASVIARAERSRPLPTPMASLPPSRPRVRLDTFLADLSDLLSRPGTLVLAVPLVDPEVDAAVPSKPPSDRPSSIPLDWSQPDLAENIAESIENGQTSFARLRNLIGRGGEPALDAIGAEMLRTSGHAAANAMFAEVLARAGRPRDVIRLVTHFAIASDPPVAARALSACSAPELPSVLRAWLEAMLPTDGADAQLGPDPHTSSAARLTACVASLEPYPHLYEAVRPLLLRVSERPPPSTSE